MFIVGHWFRYSLLYSVLGFFITTLLEPYSESKNPTRWALLIRDCSGVPKIHIHIHWTAVCNLFQLLKFSNPSLTPNVHNWMHPVRLITRCHFIKIDCCLSRATHTHSKSLELKQTLPFSACSFMLTEEIVEPDYNLPWPRQLYSAYYLKCLPPSANVHKDTEVTH